MQAQAAPPSSLPLPLDFLFIRRRAGDVSKFAGRSSGLFPSLITVSRLCCANKANIPGASDVSTRRAYSIAASLKNACSTSRAIPSRRLVESHPPLNVRCGCSVWDSVYYPMMLLPGCLCALLRRTANGLASPPKQRATANGIPSGREPIAD